MGKTTGSLVHIGINMPAPQTPGIIGAIRTNSNRMVVASMQAGRARHQDLPKRWILSGKHVGFVPILTDGDR